ncbi:MAG: hypothetical protein LKM43_03275 [Wolbachia endosymbiont of Penenirmus auritus]|nr:hypothetical protein [Wolbachia endosymbiont of Penenirmus auritus]
MSKYLELSQEGKNIASRHFEEKIAFQAYCEETDNASRALNVNLIDYNGSEPIKISDILQQEKDISKLDIYCDKNLEIRAYKKGKKRYYKFEDGACYQMKSKWPIKDESGRVVLTCTMVMDVSSEGITEITRFSGKEPNGGNYALSPEEHMELIEQNKELHIQGSPLRKAVEKFLGMQESREDIIRMEEGGSSLPDVVPKGNIGSNPTASRASEVHEEQPDLDEESNSDVQKCITSDPIKDLEAVRKQLRELRIELIKLEKKLKQEGCVVNKNGWPASELKSQIASNKDLDSRYDELQDICEKLGGLKEFICEVKERSKDQNIWHANDLSSLSNLCSFTNLLNMDIIELQKVIEVLQLQFRENLYKNDVKELIKSDPELIEGIRDISYDSGYDGDDEVSNCSVSQCRWLFRTPGRQ